MDVSNTAGLLIAGSVTFGIRAVGIIYSLSLPAYPLASRTGGGAD